jgi:hypothetical protein
LLTSYALVGARADLSDAAEIIALMAQDLNDLRREDGSATHESLSAKGWTRDQVRRYFLRALEEAFRTYCETRASACDSDRSGDNGASDRICAQAAPFIDFDKEMKAILAKAAPFNGEGAA